MHLHKYTSKREIIRTGAARRIFELINDAYAPLFGFSRMTDRQIDQYVSAYIPIIDLRMVSIVEDENNDIVAVGISMPSLSKALQKAKGKFFPWGWYHLLKALFFKHSDIIDLLLVAVLPEYQNKGVNAMLFADLIPICQQMGFKFGETHPQLETNEKSQGNGLT